MVNCIDVKICETIGSRKNFLHTLARRSPTRPQRDNINDALEYGFHGLHSKVDKIRQTSDALELTEKRFLNVVTSPRRIDEVFISEAVTLVKQYKSQHRSLVDLLNKTNAEVEPQMKEDENFRWMLKPSKDVLHLPNYLKPKIFESELNGELELLTEMLNETGESSSNAFLLKHRLGLNKEFSNIRDRMAELNKLIVKNTHSRIGELKEIIEFLGNLVLDMHPDNAEKIYNELDKKVLEQLRDATLAKLAIFYNVPLDILDHLGRGYKHYSDNYLNPIEIKGTEGIRKLQPAFNVRGQNTRMMGGSWLRIAMVNDYPRPNQDGTENVFIRSLRNIDAIREFDNNKKDNRRDKEPHLYGLGRWCEFRTLVALLQAQDELEHKIIFNPQKTTDPRLINKIITTVKDKNADHNNIDFWVKTTERETQDVYYIPLQIKHGQNGAKEAKEGIRGVDAIWVEGKNLLDLRSNVRSIIRKPRVKVSESDFNSLYVDELSPEEYRSKFSSICSRLRN